MLREVGDQPGWLWWEEEGVLVEVVNEKWSFDYGFPLFTGGMRKFNKTETEEQLARWQKKEKDEQ